MDSLRNIAASGITVTISPTQLIVGAGLLSVALVSNAKSILFAWHVNLAVLAKHMVKC